MIDVNNNGIPDDQEQVGSTDLSSILAIFDALGWTAGVPSSGTESSGPSRSTSYNQYSLQQVKGLAEAAFQDAIGRAPSKEELQRFQDSLNRAEKANPAVSTASGSSAVSTPGVDVSQFAKDTAELAPEYANYQKATKYFDTMIGALRGPVGGGM